MHQLTIEKSTDSNFVPTSGSQQFDRKAACKTDGCCFSIVL